MSSYNNLPAHLVAKDRIITKFPQVGHVTCVTNQVDLPSHTDILHVICGFREVPCYDVFSPISLSSVQRLVTVAFLNMYYVYHFISF